MSATGGKGMPSLVLSQTELRKLCELMRSTLHSHVYKRAQAVWMSYLGRPLTEIAKVINTNERTIYRWLYAFRQEGVDGLVKGPRRGRRPRITDEYKELLFRTAARTPQAFGYPQGKWTLKLLRDHMTLTTGIPVSFQRVWQILMARNTIFRVPMQ